MVMSRDKTRRNKYVPSLKKKSERKNPGRLAKWNSLLPARKKKKEKRFRSSYQARTKRPTPARGLINDSITVDRRPTFEQKNDE